MDGMPKGLPRIQNGRISLGIENLTAFFKRCRFPSASSSFPSPHRGEGGVRGNLTKCQSCFCARNSRKGKENNHEDGI